ncbi:class I SAM-dependent methyltransferase [Mesorhizobium sp. AR02]|uniref:class I SAM-dependent methyltransferase n=1 Tax=Mesorhizobium sp. AR02 TaxID=2865837 RepID=UPI00216000D3|nr:class I SAM-dependent methyltransferase [Mesorhizobium sp. AR02]UVK53939.1 class I SAM-dependent methyltransferase [Mesorhizobium sp. AR02]
MYSDGYDLGLVDPAADAARAEGFAARIDESAVTLLGCTLRPRSVVEFGAGTGALLEELARRWQLRKALGFEAASQLVASARQRDPARATIRQGYAEEALGEIAGGYDLCLSVNVLEHALSPEAFLSVSRRALSDGGHVLVICPDGDVADTELLFLDHVSSFSQQSLRMVAAAAGLHVTGSVALRGRQKGFRLTLLNSNATAREAPLDLQYLLLAQARSDFLKGWSEIDDGASEWLDDRPYAMFGAGEFRNLLRTYAPRLVKGAQALLTDKPLAATLDDRPWLRASEYASAHPQTIIVAAVNPRSWLAVAGKFRGSGMHIVHPYLFSSRLKERL